MKALAYIRFSSDEQAGGSSVERQRANIEAYADRVGLDISETLIDDGFSASKGEHIARGKLGKLLRRLSKYHGWALVVEEMDRLSRLGIAETRDIIGRLVKAGLEIHITQTGRVIRSGEDVVTELINVLESHGAAEYSRKLGERLRKAWRLKKDAAATNPGIAIKSNGPSWIQSVKGQPMTLIKGRAATVRQIFELSLAGMGSHLITQYLNDRKIPHFSSRKITSVWHASRIDKLLRDPAACGTFQPIKKVAGKAVPDGDPIPGFYPAAIDLITFRKVQEALSSRLRKHKGRGTPSMKNLFAGIVWDATLELPMTFAKWRDRELLITARYQAGKPNKIPYQTFEAAFLRFLDQLDWSDILGASDAQEITEASRLVSDISLEIERLSQKARKLEALLLDVPSKTLGDSLLATENQIISAQAKLAEAEASLIEVKRRNSDLLDRSIAYSQLVAATDPVIRAKLREEIRRKVAKIDFQFSRGTIVGRVQFVNGAVKYISFSGDKIFVMSIKSEVGS
jgi:DNA invertase Pin-like site-specific DNA recombinase